MNGPAEIILALLARHKSGQYITAKEAHQALAAWPDGQPIPTKIWDAMAVLSPIAARYVPEVPTQSEFYRKEMGAYINRARIDSWHKVNAINRRFTLAQLLLWCGPMLFWGHLKKVNIALALWAIWFGLILLLWLWNESKAKQGK